MTIYTLYYVKHLNTPRMTVIKERETQPHTHTQPGRHVKERKQVRRRGKKGCKISNSKRTKSFWGEKNSCKFMKKLEINGKQVFFFILTHPSHSRPWLFTSKLQPLPRPRAFHPPLTGFSLSQISFFKSFSWHFQGCTNISLFTFLFIIASLEEVNG